MIKEYLGLQGSMYMDTGGVEYFRCELSDKCFTILRLDSTSVNRVRRMDFINRSDVWFTGVFWWDEESHRYYRIGLDRKRSEVEIPYEQRVWFKDKLLISNRICIFPEVILNDIKLNDDYLVEEEYDGNEYKFKFDLSDRKEGIKLIVCSEKFAREYNK